MAQNKLKAIIFLGTVRENRLGIRVAKFIKQQMEEQYNYDVDFWGMYIKFVLQQRFTLFFIYTQLVTTASRDQQLVPTTHTQTFYKNK